MLSPWHLLNFHDSLTSKSLLFIWRMRNFRYIQKRESPFHRRSNGISHCYLGGAWGGGRESELTFEPLKAPRAAWVGSARLVSGDCLGDTQTKGHKRKFRVPKVLRKTDFAAKPHSGDTSNWIRHLIGFFICDTINSSLPSLLWEQNGVEIQKHMIKMVEMV